MELNEKLREAGLTGTEAKVYLELLKNEMVNGSQLAKKTKLDRTLTYQILDKLTKKGLVSYVIKEHKKYFQAADPENLLNPVKAKESFIKNLIPDLKKIEKIKDVPYEIEVYEGKAGLRVFMREVMKDKSFCSFGSTGRAYDALYEVPRLAKELSRKGFSARIIANPKYKKHEMIKVKNIEFRYLEAKSDVTTTIFADTLALHLLTQNPLIILIRNKEIAEGYKNYFEHLWKTAKK